MMTLHPKTFILSLFALKACPDALVVPQNKQKPEGKDGMSHPPLFLWPQLSLTRLRVLTYLDGEEGNV